MLMWLSEQLLFIDPGFSVFQYLTLRGILAACTALAISMLIGPVMIARLNQLQIGQTIREDGPQSHLQKAGTPTMGGALILVTVMGSTLLWADLSSRYIWVAVVTTTAFGLIGWVDDYRKVVRRDTRGLPARWKYLWQSLCAFGITLYLFDTALIPEETTFVRSIFQRCRCDDGLVVCAIQLPSCCRRE
jgi:phospho-N-acetylmuramoyl-pentapeptide-transferase